MPGMEDGSKRAIYTPDHLQRCKQLVCSQKRAVVFISAVVCVIVVISAIAAFAHPSSPHYGCISPTSVPDASSDGKSTVEPLLSTTGKLFPWTSIRLPDTIKPLSYELFVHPNLSTFRFDGNVKMLFSVTEQTDFVMFHIKRMNISLYELFEMSASGQAGNRIKVVEALECVKLELFHLQLESDILPQKVYQLRVVYSGLLTDSLTGFYRSSYETSSGEKR